MNEITNKELQSKIIAYVVANSAMSELITEGITKDHFPDYLSFVEVMYNLHNEGILVSFDSISTKFKGKAFIEVLDLLNTNNDFFFQKNFSFYCDLLKQDHKKAEFKKLLSSSLSNFDTLDIQEEVSKYSSFEKETATQTIKRIDSLESKMVQLLNSDKAIGLKTGLDFFDKPSGGCKRGKLITIAGRPAMGKTAFVLCLLEGLMIQNISCGFISLEMTEEEIIDRFICMQNFDNDFIRNEDHRKQGLIKDQYLNTLKNVCTLPLYIDEDSGVIANKIKEKLYSMASKGCKVVAIDYLQLIQLKGNKTTTEEIGEITRMLKALAKKLDMTIFLLSQLSREVEKRKDKVPTLADLRSSGDIEQDSDMVIFLYRPLYYIEKGSLDASYVYQNLQLEQDQTAIIIDKNRGGASGRTIAYFEGKHYKFSE